VWEIKYLCGTVFYFREVLVSKSYNYIFRKKHPRYQIPLTLSLNLSHMHPSLSMFVRDLAQALLHFSSGLYTNSLPCCLSTAGHLFLSVYNKEHSTRQLQSCLCWCVCLMPPATKAQRGSGMVQVASTKFRPRVGLCQPKKLKIL
jgi:hypothetical protein